MKAYAIRAVQKHDAAQAEVTSVRAELDKARADYVNDPSDHLAGVIAKKRECVELAELRAQKPAQALQDALAAVTAAEQTLAEAKAEEAEQRRQESIRAQVAYDTSFNDRVAPLWQKLFAAYEATLEAARQIDSEGQAVALVAHGLTLGGVPNLGNSSARIFEHPIKELYDRTTPTEQLIQDATIARVGGLMLPGGVVPSRIAPLVTNQLFEFLLRYQGGAPSREEQKRVHAFFADRCRPAQAPVETPPEFPPCGESTISHWVRDSDGTRYEIQAETWSDGTRRMPARERELSARILGEEWSYAEREVRRARLISTLPDVLPESPNPNTDVHANFRTSGESQASPLL